MENLSNSLKQSIAQNNWYAALMLALTLPDICGKVEFPNDRSSKRYKKWCKKYLEPKYTRQVGPKSKGYVHTFLSASDCYALRCALLHEGSGDITEQKAQETLTHFHFTAPNEKLVMHSNLKNSVLQLQVDLFAKDILQSISEWLGEIQDDTDKMKSLNELIAIHDSFAL